jgi:hypothetical protein
MNYDVLLIYFLFFGDSHLIFCDDDGRNARHTNVEKRKSVMNADEANTNHVILASVSPTAKTIVIDITGDFIIFENSRLLFFLAHLP